MVDEVLVVHPSKKPQSFVVGLPLGEHTIRTSKDRMGV